MMHKTYRNLIFEGLALAILISIIPDLLMNGLFDLIFACGFSEAVCQQIKLEAIYKLVAGIVFILIALFVLFLISKEYNADVSSTQGGDNG